MPDRKPATDLLRTKEAADRLRLSPRTLDRWRVTGGGPKFIRLGTKSVAYSASDLAEWLATNTHDNTNR